MTEVAEQTGSPVCEVFAPLALAQILGGEGGRGIDVPEAAVPSEIRAFRELESLRFGFGVDDPGEIHRGPHRLPGFTVLSHGSQTTAFPAPSLPAAPGVGSAAGAILECRIPKGTQAIWPVGHGDQSGTEESDLILLCDAVLEIEGSRVDGEVQVVESVVVLTNTRSRSTSAPARRRRAIRPPAARPVRKASRIPAGPSQPPAR